VIAMEVMMEKKKKKKKPPMKMTVKKEKEKNPNNVEEFGLNHSEMKLLISPITAKLNSTNINSFL